MISYAVYKVLHLTGVMMVFFALGGVATNAINGGERKHAWRVPIAITHGLGLVLSLVAGFGLLARLGIAHGGIPGWVMVKLGIWFFFAGAIGILIRKPALGKILWPIIIVLGILAAYLAGAKSL